MQTLYTLHGVSHFKIGALYRSRVPLSSRAGVRRAVKEECGVGRGPAVPRRSVGGGWRRSAVLGNARR